jgi:hypothetical protein
MSEQQRLNRRKNSDGGDGGWGASTELGEPSTCRSSQLIRKAVDVHHFLHAQLLQH